MAKKQTKEETKKVVPMHFCIEEKDIEKQYDCESFCLYKAGGFMHYMTKGGYHVFVKPDYASLYGTLELLLDTLIAVDGKPQGEKENILNVADFVSTLLFAPTMLFADEDVMFKAFVHIQEFVQQMYEKATKELSIEDFDKNNDFEQAVKSAEETIEKLKGIADALPQEQED